MINQYIVHTSKAAIVTWAKDGQTAIELVMMAENCPAAQLFARASPIMKPSILSLKEQGE